MGGLAWLKPGDRLVVLVDNVPETAVIDVDDQVHERVSTKNGVARFEIPAPKKRWTSGVHRVLVRGSAGDVTGLDATGFRVAGRRQTPSGNKTASPTQGKPYVQVLSPQNFGGTATLKPDEKLVVIARGAPQSAVIRVDGQLHERISTENGIARFEIPAPNETWRLGMHEVRLLQSSTGSPAVLDATAFNVPAQDKEK
jgi:hypothetical protein